MNKAELKQWIEQLMQEDKLYRFYKSKEWQKKKDKVLKEFHNECAWCKEKGRISLATQVHHIQYVKTHPELALDEYYTHKGKRHKNLLNDPPKIVHCSTLCKSGIYSKS